MAQCSSCSAPLPSDSWRCSYCGTRNDMDFTAVNRFAFDRQPSRRQCPDCEVPLQTVRIDTGGGIFAIERCERCFGLFFDVGEVQAFLDASVSPAFSINLRQIANINEERGRTNESIRYKKCPECGVLMNRINYAAMSGVVIDQCKEHGMWLDNGELVHLMEWRKAGGKLLAERKEKQAQQERHREHQTPVPHYSGTGGAGESPTGDLVSTVCTILLDTLLR
jgi:Zn-finger nucleic acid-binding protein